MQEGVFINQVLQRCEALVAAGIWDRAPVLNPRGWLNNFHDSEKAIAATLLANTTYVSSEATKRLFRAAFAKLQQHCFVAGSSRADLVNNFNQLLSSCVLTAITGETESDVDSGKQFARMARDIIGLPEEQIANHARAIDLAEQGRAIVFADDILGTGHQLSNMWDKSINGRSFRSLHSEHAFPCYGVFPLATASGIVELERMSIPIQILTAHTIASDHSIYELQDDPILPNVRDLQTRIPDLLRKHASRLQPPKTFSEPDWYHFGYENLALLVLFSHKAPDFSLPILSWGGPQFEPLFTVGAL